MSEEEDSHTGTRLGSESSDSFVIFTTFYTADGYQTRQIHELDIRIHAAKEKLVQQLGMCFL